MIPPLLQAVPTRYHRLLIIFLLGAVGFTALLALGVSSRRAFSIPLYARQTGQPCATCHTAFLELTPFGRRFKLGGYTLGGGDWTGPPFAVMLQAPTYTHTEAGQEGGAAPHFGTNNNFAFQQVSLFTGGRITANLGAFIQGTYDGVARRFGWDNTDIRFAKSINVDGHTLLWGVTANNNPTVQDVWEHYTCLELSLYQLGFGADADCQHVYRSSIRATGRWPHRLCLRGRPVLFRVRRLSPPVDQHAKGSRHRHDRSEPDQRCRTLLAARGGTEFWRPFMGSRDIWARIEGLPAGAVGRGHRLLHRCWG